VLALTLDVTRPEHISNAVAAAHKRFGRIDVLVNNAGYGFLSGAEEASDAEVRAQFEVNFFGLAALTRAVLPIMRQQRSGCVVNLSSVAGSVAFAGSAYYSATKFAVGAFSEALAQETAAFGIRVLLVEPGAFRTEFFGRSMAVPANPIAAYQSLADMRGKMAQLDGKQPGNTTLGAQAIVDAVSAEQHPFRLLLGRSSIEHTRKALRARLAELDQLESVAQSVDYPNVPGVMS
jgi:NAD(P)-dependent dehydrogenase (short-subunit alcohol dehydrogenase family)